MAFVLDRRNRFRLIISGAVLGALIGPLGLWLDLRPRLSPGTTARFGSFSDVVGRWLTNVWALDSGWTGLLVLAVPFVATLILMPRFIRWLEKRADRSSGPFYLRAGLGGVVFGALATALIAWGLLVAAVIAGTLDNRGDTDPADAGAAIAGGSLIFGPLMGLFAPFLFIPSIVGLGIPFGLLYGALVRHLARDDESARR